MPTSNIMTPDRFPLLDSVANDAVVWVILNNTDYHITLGALKNLMVESLPPAELPADIVTTQQLADAINNIEPIDLQAVVTAYFQDNPVALPEGVVTDDNIAENPTVMALIESLDKKVGTNMLEGYATVSKVEEMLLEQTVEFTPVNYTPESNSLLDHLKAIDAALGSVNPG